MNINTENILKECGEAVIVYIGVFLTITLYGLYADDIDVQKNAIVSLIICGILELAK